MKCTKPGCDCAAIVAFDRCEGHMGAHQVALLAMNRDEAFAELRAEREQSRFLARVELRRVSAAAALEGLLAQGWHDRSQTTPESIAILAWTYADAMLATENADTHAPDLAAALERATEAAAKEST